MSERIHRPKFLTGFRIQNKDFATASHIQRVYLILRIYVVTHSVFAAAPKGQTLLNPSVWC